MERERLRKENQHLRELLNAMHERQRVESKLVSAWASLHYAQRSHIEPHISIPLRKLQPTEQ